jgi:hypothetical protein
VFGACSHVVGVGIVAANTLTVVNLGSMLVGGGLCAVAAGLHARSDGGGGGLEADTALLVLGGAVLAMSALGLLASRLHSRCLLRLYGGFALAVTVGLLAFVGVLSFVGVKGLSDSAFLTVCDRRSNLRSTPLRC